ncbi:MAG: amidase [Caldilineaceae bacterium]|nr:amidase [Caldilineaceae bacterium]
MSNLNPAALATDVEQLRSGQLELHAYIEQMCDRLEEVDAVIQSFLPAEKRRQRLHEEADALLARYPEPAARPPLFGALVGVKDIFHVDGYITRAGSDVPPALFAGDEAVCVRQLRDAGALIMGKTVTTEFAFFEPGPTRNPHNTEHTPGGSSSGSAAAMAAGLCTLSLGTQTIGSVIRPAAYCGVVGFKPSYDRIATPGLVYFSRTVDHVGLFTQDVASMLLAASVLCANWSGDFFMAKMPVLGVPDGPYLQQAQPAALALFAETVQQLQASGLIVKRVPTLANIDELNVLHRRLAAAEFAQEHAQMYAQYADHYRPRTADMIQLGQTVSAEEVDNGRANCVRLRLEMQAQMQENGIDLWVCPPAPGPAPVGIHATGDPVMNLPWTHTGMPAVTIPTGQTMEGLPLGLQLVGQFGADEQVLNWAQMVEGVL